jgi:uncharacterized protein YcaQ
MWHGHAISLVMPITLDDLRRFAVDRTFFAPTTLKRAIHRMGFVQADPIRAPARAQDLTLRHRVRDYVAGDLERRYSKLGIEEDFFVTYGFVTRSLQALIHPRSKTGVPADEPRPWPAERRKRAQLLLDFVRERGAVHPRAVDDHFSHGRVKNYWGGSSNATTHLLDAAPLARPRHRLGHRLGEERQARVRARLCRIAPARSRLQARARGRAGSHASLPGTRPSVVILSEAKDLLWSAGADPSSLRSSG